MASRNLSMSTLGVVAIPLLLGSLLAGSAFAQSPTYGVGRTPSAEELRRMDISIGFAGEELPPGRGNAKEGAQLYMQKACVGCHGVTGIGGLAPILRSKMENADTLPVWKKERILPLRAPSATIVWDFINRGMPVGLEGTLKPDEVYSLTAYLLFLNKVIPEDQVLTRENLPKVKMPIGDAWGKPHDFKVNAPRLEGYPY
jgi:mono/diheme cytochrome c family protein